MPGEAPQPRFLADLDRPDPALIGKSGSSRDTTTNQPVFQESIVPYSLSSAPVSCPRRMANRLLAIAALIGSFLTAGPTFAVDAPQAKAPVFPYPIKTSKLENGLTIVTVPTDSPGVISYYTIVRTGSRNEVEPGLSGFAHFFEHMMFRGTPRNPQEKYNDRLKQLGADTNAFTTDDWTAYHSTLSSDEPGFQKEARAVLGEYNKIASSPMMLLDETLQDTAFDKHTYKHTTIGFLKDIVDMPNQYEYSRKFFERWYRPDNCIVLVVGDVKHNEVVELARRNYGPWKPGVAKVDIEVEPPQTAERRRDLTWKGVTQPYLYIGFHIPAFDAGSREIAALDVLSEALFSQVSPLYRQLVLEESKAEMISGGAAFHRDPSLFTIMVRLRDAADLPAVEKAIYEAIEQAASKRLPAAQLADIKSHLRYGFASQLESTGAVARAVGSFLELTGDPDSLNQMYDTYEQVTAADVQAAAAKFFLPTNRTVITLLSEADAANKAKPADEKKSAAAPKAADETSNAEVAKVQPVAYQAPKAAAPKTAAPKTAAPNVAAPKASARRTVAQKAAAPKATAPKTPVAQAPPAKAPAVTSKIVSPLVSMRITFNVGSQQDPTGKEGLAALTARLVSEGGSKDFTYSQLLEKLYPIAGAMGGGCDKEITVFTGQVHQDKLDDFYKLFADVLLRPRFDNADFERLRQEQLSLVSKRLRGNDDENLGKAVLQQMLYPASHPYGHLDYGTVAGLKSITLDDVKNFYQKNYTKGALSTAVAGGTKNDLVEKLSTEFAAALADGQPTRPDLPAPSKLQDLEVTIIEKPAIATAISLGFPLDVTRADDDFYLLAVANSAFGEHRTFNGRLMKNMRGKRGLNYGDYAYIENFIQDGGSTFPIPGTPRRQQFFSIWLRPVPHDKGVFALREAVRELDMLVKNGLTEQEFEATRNFLLHYSKLWVQNQSRRLGYEQDGKFYERKSLVEELANRLPTMTLEQVNNAIRKRLQADNLAVVLVTDDGARLKEQLLSGKPSPLVYDTQGTPPEIIEEDKVIESWPLKINIDRLKIVPAEELFEQ
jgi:zinc protease